MRPNHDYLRPRRIVLYPMLAIVAGLLLMAGPASAQELSQNSEMTGIRAMGMGEAFTANASGTGALFHNAAGISNLMMYSMEAAYVFDQATGLNHIHASIVDGKSNPMLGGGVGYTYSTSSDDARLADFSSHNFYGGLAAPLVPGWLSVGVLVHYFDYMQGDQDLVDGFTFDGGLVLDLGDFINVGAAMRNINEIEGSGRTRELHFGLSYNSGMAGVAVDTGFHFIDASGPYSSMRAGLELLLAEIVPIRLGYMYAEYDAEHLISGGAGWRSQSVGLDLLYRQSVVNSSNRMMGLALNLYM